MLLLLPIEMWNCNDRSNRGHWHYHSVQLDRSDNEIQLGSHNSIVLFFDTNANHCIDIRKIFLYGQLWYKKETSGRMRTHDNCKCSDFRLPLYIYDDQWLTKFITNPSFDFLVMYPYAPLGLLQNDLLAMGVTWGSSRSSWKSSKRSYKLEIVSISSK